MTLVSHIIPSFINNTRTLAIASYPCSDLVSWSSAVVDVAINQQRTRRQWTLVRTYMS